MNTVTLYEPPTYGHDQPDHHDWIVSVEADRREQLADRKITAVVDWADRRPENTADYPCFDWVAVAVAGPADPFEGL